MNNEHMFATFRETDTPGATPEQTAGSVGGKDPRIGEALDVLREARIGPMSHSEAEETYELLTRIESVAGSLKCDMAEMLTTNRDSGDGGTGPDPVEVMRRAGRMPDRESKRVAKVARQLAAMPKVKEKFAAGEITPGQANALANAAEKVGPDAVNDDPTLLEAADRLLPDSFDRHARRWSNRKLIEAGIDPVERQRRAREGKMWMEKDTGLGVVHVKLPRPQFEHFRQAVDGHYMYHLRQDGKREEDGSGAGSGGGRTSKQRIADAIYELVTNRNAFTGETLGETTGIRAKASTQLIVVAPTGVLDGTDPDGQVEIVGVGPVPRRFLATLTPDTELAAMLFDRKGRPLWLGRNQRLGNAAQRLAVAVRDGGCFECGAPMHRCELHHMKEWYRDGGRTDVDNLVAVCRRHHRWLETDNLEVRRTDNGYQTRPRARTRPPANPDPPPRTLEPG